MPDSRNKLKVWLAPMLLFFGGFFLLLAAQEGCYQSAETLSAVVVAKEYSPGTTGAGSRSGSSSSRHSVRYRFTSPQGETKEASSMVLLQNWSRLRVGDSIEIEYLPATGDSRVTDQTATAPVFLSIAAILLIAGFIVRRTTA